MQPIFAVTLSFVDEKCLFWYCRQYAENQRNRFLLMPIRIWVTFKNCRFLTLKPLLLADETVVFSIKNHRFLREKARNQAVLSFCRFSKTRFYAMQTWQIVVFCFLFRKKSRWLFFFTYTGPFISCM